MRGYFSHSTFPRTIQEITTLKFKSEVIFITYTVTEVFLNCLFRIEVTMSLPITSIVGWFPVCPVLGVALLSGGGEG